MNVVSDFQRIFTSLSDMLKIDKSLQNVPSRIFHDNSDPLFIHKNDAKLSSNQEQEVTLEPLREKPVEQLPAICIREAATEVYCDANMIGLCKLVFQEQEDYLLWIL